MKDTKGNNITPEEFMEGTGHSVEMPSYTHKKDIKVGVEVIVFDGWGRPQYIGKCIGISERGVLIRKKGLFGGETVAKIADVDYLETNTDILRI